MRFSGALLCVVAALTGLVSATGSNLRDCGFADPKFFIRHSSTETPARIDYELFPSDPWDQSQLDYTLPLPVAVLGDEDAELVLNYKRKHRQELGLSFFIYKDNSVFYEMDNVYRPLDSYSYGDPNVEEIVSKKFKINGIDRYVVVIQDNVCGQWFTFDLRSQAYQQSLDPQPASHVLEFSNCHNLRVLDLTTWIDSTNVQRIEVLTKCDAFDVDPATNHILTYTVQPFGYLSGPEDSELISGAGVFDEGRIFVFTVQESSTVTQVRAAISNPSQDMRAGAALYFASRDATTGAWSSGSAVDLCSASTVNTPSPFLCGDGTGITDYTKQLYGVRAFNSLYLSSVRAVYRQATLLQTVMYFQVKNYAGTADANSVSTIWEAVLNSTGGLPNVTNAATRDASVFRWDASGASQVYTDVRDLLSTNLAGTSRAISFAIAVNPVNSILMVISHVFGAPFATVGDTNRLQSDASRFCITYVQTPQVLGFQLFYATPDSSNANNVIIRTLRVDDAGSSVIPGNTLSSVTLSHPFDNLLSIKCPRLITEERALSSIFAQFGQCYNELTTEFINDRTECRDKGQLLNRAIPFSWADAVYNRTALPNSTLSHVSIAANGANTLTQTVRFLPLNNYLEDPVFLNPKVSQDDSYFISVDVYRGQQRLVALATDAYVAAAKPAKTNNLLTRRLEFCVTAESGRVSCAQPQTISTVSSRSIAKLEVPADAKAFLVDYPAYYFNSATRAMEQTSPMFSVDGGATRVDLATLNQLFSNGTVGGNCFVIDMFASSTDTIGQRLFVAPVDADEQCGGHDSVFTIQWFSGSGEERVPLPMEPFRAYNERYNVMVQPDVTELSFEVLGVNYDAGSGVTVPLSPLIATEQNANKVIEIEEFGVSYIFNFTVLRLSSLALDGADLYREIDFNDARDVVLDTVPEFRPEVVQYYHSVPTGDGLPVQIAVDMEHTAVADALAGLGSFVVSGIPADVDINAAPFNAEVYVSLQRQLGVYRVQLRRTVELISFQEVQVNDVDNAAMWPTFEANKHHRLLRTIDSAEQLNNLQVEVRWTVDQGVAGVEVKAGGEVVALNELGAGHVVAKLAGHLFSGFNEVEIQVELANGDSFSYFYYVQAVPHLTDLQLVGLPAQLNDLFGSHYYSTLTNAIDYTAVPFASATRQYRMFTVASPAQLMGGLSVNASWLESVDLEVDIDVNGERFGLVSESSEVSNGLFLRLGANTIELTVSKVHPCLRLIEVENSGAAQVQSQCVLTTSYEVELFIVAPINELTFTLSGYDNVAEAKQLNVLPIENAEVYNANGVIPDVDTASYRVVVPVAAALSLEDAPVTIAVSSSSVLADTYVDIRCGVDINGVEELDQVILSAENCASLEINSLEDIILISLPGVAQLYEVSLTSAIAGTGVDAAFLTASYDVSEHYDAEVSSVHVLSVSARPEYVDVLMMLKDSADATEAVVIMTFAVDSNGRLSEEPVDVYGESLEDWPFDFTGPTLTKQVADWADFSEDMSIISYEFTMENQLGVSKHLYVCNPAAPGLFWLSWDADTNTWYSPAQRVGINLGSFTADMNSQRCTHLRYGAKQPTTANGATEAVIVLVADITEVSPQKRTDRAMRDLVEIRVDRETGSHCTSSSLAPGCLSADETVESSLVFWWSDTDRLFQDTNHRLEKVFDVSVNYPHISVVGQVRSSNSDDLVNGQDVVIVYHKAFSVQQDSVVISDESFAPQLAAGEPVDGGLASILVEDLDYTAVTMVIDSQMYLTVFAVDAVNSLVHSVTLTLPADVTKAIPVSYSSRQVSGAASVVLPPALDVYTSRVFVQLIDGSVVAVPFNWRAAHIVGSRADAQDDVYDSLVFRDADAFMLLSAFAAELSLDPIPVAVSGHVVFDVSLELDQAAVRAVDIDGLELSIRSALIGTFSTAETVISAGLERLNSNLELAGSSLWSMDSIPAGVRASDALHTVFTRYPKAAFAVVLTESLELVDNLINIDATVRVSTLVAEAGVDGTSQYSLFGSYNERDVGDQVCVQLELASSFQTATESVVYIAPLDATVECTDADDGEALFSSFEVSVPALRPWVARTQVACKDNCDGTTGLSSVLGDEFRLVDLSSTRFTVTFDDSTVDNDVESVNLSVDFEEQYVQMVVLVNGAIVDRVPAANFPVVVPLRVGSNSVSLYVRHSNLWYELDSWTVVRELSQIAHVELRGVTEGTVFEWDGSATSYDIKQVLQYPLHSAKNTVYVVVTMVSGSTLVPTLGAYVADEQDDGSYVFGPLDLNLGENVLKLTDGTVDFEAELNFIMSSGLSDVQVIALDEHGQEVELADLHYSYDKLAYEVHIPYTEVLTGLRLRYVLDDPSAVVPLYLQVDGSENWTPMSVNYGQVVLDDFIELADDAARDLLVLVPTIGVTYRFRFSVRAFHGAYDMTPLEYDVSKEISSVDTSAIIAAYDDGSSLFVLTADGTLFHLPLSASGQPDFSALSHRALELPAGVRSVSIATVKDGNDYDLVLCDGTETNEVHLYRSLESTPLTLNLNVLNSTVSGLSSLVCADLEADQETGYVFMQLENPTTGVLSSIMEWKVVGYDEENPGPVSAFAWRNYELTHVMYDTYTLTDDITRFVFAWGEFTESSGSKTRGVFYHVVGQPNRPARMNALIAGRSVPVASCLTVDVRNPAELVPAVYQYLVSVPSVVGSGLKLDLYSMQVRGTTFTFNDARSVDVLGLDGSLLDVSSLGAVVSVLCPASVTDEYSASALLIEFASGFVSLDIDVDAAIQPGNVQFLGVASVLDQYHPPHIARVLSVQPSGLRLLAMDQSTGKLEVFVGEASQLTVEDDRLVLNSLFVSVNGQPVVADGDFSAFDAYSLVLLDAGVTLKDFEISGWWSPVYPSPESLFAVINHDDILSSLDSGVSQLHTLAVSLQKDSSCASVTLLNQLTLDYTDLVTRRLYIAPRDESKQCDGDALTVEFIAGSIGADGEVQCDETRKLPLTDVAFREYVRSYDYFFSGDFSTLCLRVSGAARRHGYVSVRVVGHDDEFVQLSADESEHYTSHALEDLVSSFGATVLVKFSGSLAEWDLNGVEWQFNLEPVSIYKLAFVDQDGVDVPRFGDELESLSYVYVNSAVTELSALVRSYDIDRVGLYLTAYYTGSSPVVSNIEESLQDVYGAPFTTEQLERVEAELFYGVDAHGDVLSFSYEVRVVRGLDGLEVSDSPVASIVDVEFSPSVFEYSVSVVESSVSDVKFAVSLPSGFAASVLSCESVDECLDRQGDLVGAALSASTQEVDLVRLLGLQTIPVGRYVFGLCVHAANGACAFPAPVYTVVVDVTPVLSDLVVLGEEDALVSSLIARGLLPVGAEKQFEFDATEVDYDMRSLALPALVAGGHAVYVEFADSMSVMMRVNGGPEVVVNSRKPTLGLSLFSGYNEVVLVLSEEVDDHVLVTEYTVTIYVESGVVGVSLVLQDESNVHHSLEVEPSLDSTVYDYVIYAPLGFTDDVVPELTFSIDFAPGFEAELSELWYTWLEGDSMPAVPEREVTHTDVAVHSLTEPFVTFLAHLIGADLTYRFRVVSGYMYAGLDLHSKHYDLLAFNGSLSVVDLEYMGGAQPSLHALVYNPVSHSVDIAVYNYDADDFSLSLDSDVQFSGLSIHANEYASLAVFRGDNSGGFAAAVCSPVDETLYFFRWNAAQRKWAAASPASYLLSNVAQALNNSLCFNLVADNPSDLSQQVRLIVGVAENSTGSYRTIDVLEIDITNGLPCLAGAPACRDNAVLLWSDKLLNELSVELNRVDSFGLSTDGFVSFASIQYNLVGQSDASLARLYGRKRTEPFLFLIDGTLLLGSPVCISAVSDLSFDGVEADYGVVSFSFLDEDGTQVGLFVDFYDQTKFELSLVLSEGSVEMPTSFRNAATGKLTPTGVLCPYRMTVDGRTPLYMFDQGEMLMAPVHFDRDIIPGLFSLEGKPFWDFFDAYSLAWSAGLLPLVVDREMIAYDGTAFPLYADADVNQYPVLFMLSRADTSDAAAPVTVLTPYTTLAAFSNEESYLLPQFLAITSVTGSLLMPTTPGPAYLLPVSPKSSFDNCTVEELSRGEFDAACGIIVFASTLKSDAYSVVDGEPLMRVVINHNTQQDAYVSVRGASDILHAIDSVPTDSTVLQTNCLWVTVDSNEASSSIYSAPEERIYECVPGSALNIRTLFSTGAAGVSAVKTTTAQYRETVAQYEVFYGVSHMGMHTGVVQLTGADVLVQDDVLGVYTLDGETSRDVDIRFRDDATWVGETLSAFDKLEYRVTMTPIGFGFLEVVDETTGEDVFSYDAETATQTLFEELSDMENRLLVDADVSRVRFVADWNVPHSRAFIKLEQADLTVEYPLPVLRVPSLPIDLPQGHFLMSIVIEQQNQTETSQTEYRLNVVRGALITELVVGVRVAGDSSLYPAAPAPTCIWSLSVNKELPACTSGAAGASSSLFDFVTEDLVNYAQFLPYHLLAEGRVLSIAAQVDATAGSVHWWTSFNSTRQELSSVATEVELTAEVELEKRFSVYYSVDSLEQVFEIEYSTLAFVGSVDPLAQVTFVPDHDVESDAVLSRAEISSAEQLQIAVDRDAVFGVAAASSEYTVLDVAARAGSVPNVFDVLFRELATSVSVDGEDYSRLFLGSALVDEATGEVHMDLDAAVELHGVEYVVDDSIGSEPLFSQMKYFTDAQGKLHLVVPVHVYDPSVDLVGSALAVLTASSPLNLAAWSSTVQTFSLERMLLTQQERHDEFVHLQLVEFALSSEYAFLVVDQIEVSSGDRVDQLVVSLAWYQNVTTVGPTVSQYCSLVPQCPLAYCQCPQALRPRVLSVALDLVGESLEGAEGSVSIAAVPRTRFQSVAFIGVPNQFSAGSSVIAFNVSSVPAAVSFTEAVANHFASVQSKIVELLSTTQLNVADLAVTLIVPDNVVVITALAREQSGESSVLVARITPTGRLQAQDHTATHIDVMQHGSTTDLAVLMMPSVVSMSSGILPQHIHIARFVVMPSGLEASYVLESVPFRWNALRGSQLSSPFSLCHGVDRLPAFGFPLAFGKTFALSVYPVPGPLAFGAQKVAEVSSGAAFLSALTLSAANSDDEPKRILPQFTSGSAYQVLSYDVLDNGFDSLEICSSWFAGPNFTQMVTFSNHLQGELLTNSGEQSTLVPELADTNCYSLVMRTYSGDEEAAQVFVQPLDDLEECAGDAFRIDWFAVDEEDVKLQQHEVVTDVATAFREYKTSYAVYPQIEESEVKVELSGAVVSHDFASTKCVVVYVGGDDELETQFTLDQATGVASAVLDLTLYQQPFVFEVSCAGLPSKTRFHSWTYHVVPQTISSLSLFAVSDNELDIPALSIDLLANNSLPAGNSYSVAYTSGDAYQGFNAFQLEYTVAVPYAVKAVQLKAKWASPSATVHRYAVADAEPSQYLYRPVRLLKTVPLEADELPVGVPTTVQVDYVARPGRLVSYKIHLVRTGPVSVSFATVTPHRALAFDQDVYKYVVVAPAVITNLVHKVSASIVSGPFAVQSISLDVDGDNEIVLSVAAANDVPLQVGINRVQVIARYSAAGVTTSYAYTMNVFLTAVVSAVPVAYNSTTKDAVPLQMPVSFLWSVPAVRYVTYEFVDTVVADTTYQTQAVFLTVTANGGVAEIEYAPSVLLPSSVAQPETASMQFETNTSSSSFDMVLAGGNNVVLVIHTDNLADIADVCGSLQNCVIEGVDVTSFVAGYNSTRTYTITVHLPSVMRLPLVLIDYDGRQVQPVALPVSTTAGLVNSKLVESQFINTSVYSFDYQLQLSSNNTLNQQVFVPVEYGVSFDADFGLLAVFVTRPDGSSRIEPRLAASDLPLLLNDIAVGQTRVTLQFRNSYERFSEYRLSILRPGVFNSFNATWVNGAATRALVTQATADSTDVDHYPWVSVEKSLRLSADFADGAGFWQVDVEVNGAKVGVLRNSQDSFVVSADLLLAPSALGSSSKPGWNEIKMTYLTTRVNVPVLKTRVLYVARHTALQSVSLGAPVQFSSPAAFAVNTVSYSASESYVLLADSSVDTGVVDFQAMKLSLTAALSQQVAQDVLALEVDSVSVNLVSVASQYTASLPQLSVAAVHDVKLTLTDFFGAVTVYTLRVVVPSAVRFTVSQPVVGRADLRLVSAAGSIGSALSPVQLAAGAVRLLNLDATATSVSIAISESSTACGAQLLSANNVGSAPAPASLAAVSGSASSLSVPLNVADLTAATVYTAVQYKPGVCGTLPAGFTLSMIPVRNYAFEVQRQSSLEMVTIRNAASGSSVVASFASGLFSSAVTRLNLNIPANTQSEQIVYVDAQTLSAVLVSARFSSRATLVVRGADFDVPVSPAGTNSPAVEVPLLGGNNVVLELRDYEVQTFTVRLYRRSRINAMQLLFNTVQGQLVPFTFDRTQANQGTVVLSTLYRTIGGPADLSEVSLQLRATFDTAGQNMASGLQSLQVVSNGGSAVSLTASADMNGMQTVMLPLRAGSNVVTGTYSDNAMMTLQSFSLTIVVPSQLVVSSIAAPSAGPSPAALGVAWDVQTYTYAQQSLTYSDQRTLTFTGYVTAVSQSNVVRVIVNNGSPVSATAASDGAFTISAALVAGVNTVQLVYNSQVSGVAEVRYTLSFRAQSKVISLKMFNADDETELPINYSQSLLPVQAVPDNPVIVDGLTVTSVYFEAEYEEVVGEHLTVNFGRANVVVPNGAPTPAYVLGNSRVNFTFTLNSAVTQMISVPVVRRSFLLDMSFRYGIDAPALPVAFPSFVFNTNVVNQPAVVLDETVVTRRHSVDASYAQQEVDITLTYILGSITEVSVTYAASLSRPVQNVTLASVSSGNAVRLVVASGANTVQVRFVDNIGDEHVHRVVITLPDVPLVSSVWKAVDVNGTELETVRPDAQVVSSNALLLAPLVTSTQSAEVHSPFATGLLISAVSSLQSGGDAVTASLNGGSVVSLSSTGSVVVPGLVAGANELVLRFTSVRGVVRTLRFGVQRQGLVSSLVVSSASGPLSLGFVPTGNLSTSYSAVVEYYAVPQVQITAVFDTALNATLEGSYGRVAPFTGLQLATGVSSTVPLRAGSNIINLAYNSLDQQNITLSITRRVSNDSDVYMLVRAYVLPSSDAVTKTEPYYDSYVPALCALVDIPVGRVEPAGFSQRLVDGVVHIRWQVKVLASTDENGGGAPAAELLTAVQSVIVRDSAQSKAIYDRFTADSVSLTEVTISPNPQPIDDQLGAAAVSSPVLALVMSLVAAVVALL